jgi:hypothetical protein
MSQARRDTTGKKRRKETKKKKERKDREEKSLETGGVFDLSSYILNKYWMRTFLFRIRTDFFD